MTVDRIREILYNEGFDSCRILTYDTSYAAVTVPSLQGWYKWGKRLLWTFGIRKWHEQFDCDKFSRFMKAMAFVVHWKSMRKRPNLPQCPAIATVCYLIDGKPGNGHMINLAITNRGVMFIEPQEKFLEFKALTPKERKSIWEIAF